MSHRSRRIARDGKVVLSCYEVPFSRCCRSGNPGIFSARFHLFFFLVFFLILIPLSYVTGASVLSSLHLILRPRHDTVSEEVSNIRAVNATAGVKIDQELCAGEGWQARRGRHCPCAPPPRLPSVSSRGHLVPTAMVAEHRDKFELCETINPTNNGLMVRTRTCVE